VFHVKFWRGSKPTPAISNARRATSPRHYAAVGSLAAEIRGKLAAARPSTLGAVAQISGVTPAALVALV
jgi:tRNA U34 5-carboxymethylaminomethyl modifying enzyme MnmG/GidA